MDPLRKEVRWCHKCGPEYMGKAACGIGSEKKDGVFLIGMNPWTKAGEFDMDRGKGINILLDYFKEWQFEHWFFDNVVKCQCKPTHENATNCRQYLQDQLKYLKPRLIVTFGKFASEEFFEGTVNYVPWTMIKGPIKMINQINPKLISVVWIEDAPPVEMVPHFSSHLYPGGITRDLYYRKLKKIFVRNPVQRRLF